VVHAQLMCNILSRANRQTGYRIRLVPEDIISYPFEDLQSHRCVRRLAPIPYAGIGIRAYNKTRQDESDYSFCFSRPRLVS